MIARLSLTAIVLVTVWYVLDRVLSYLFLIILDAL